MSDTDTLFTDEGLKELKYATVELIMKKNDNIATIGLLLAVRPLVEFDTPLVDKDEKFVWILKDNHVHILSTKHYDIGNIEMGVGKDANMHKLIAYDHNISIKRLEAIISALKAQERTDDNGIIDTNTYSGIPGALKKLVGATSTFTEIVRKTASSTATTSKAATGYTPALVKKKVVSTAIIKRTTRYPTSLAIEKMRLKVQSIKNNEYESPDIPEIEADKIIREAKSKKKQK